MGLVRGGSSDSLRPCVQVGAGFNRDYWARFERFVQVGPRWRLPVGVAMFRVPWLRILLAQLLTLKLWFVESLCRT